MVVAVTGGEGRQGRIGRRRSVHGLDERIDIDFGDVRQSAGLEVANNAAYAFASPSGDPVDMLAGADGARYVLTRSTIVRISVP